LKVISTCSGKLLDGLVGLEKRAPLLFEWRQRAFRGHRYDLGAGYNRILNITYLENPVILVLSNTVAVFVSKAKKVRGLKL
jgi:hypothetical protein